MPADRDLLRKLSELLVRSATLKQEGRLAEAAALVGDGCRSLFGIERRSLQRLQPSQVAASLADSRQAWALAQLLSEEGDLLLRQGDRESASATAGFILALLTAARVPEDAELLGRLRALQVS